MTDLGSPCRFRLTVALAICLTMVAVTESKTQSTRRGDEQAALAAAVAVLPFVNISGTAADDWIGRGIAETVTADLDRLGVLDVVGPEAVLERASAIGDGGPRDEMTSRIGRALGVRWVVAGGVQRAGDRVRVTARVIDVGSGDVAQSITIDGTIADVFALQDRIVAELGQGFGPFAGDARALGRASRPEPEAAVRRANGAAAPGGRTDATRIDASGAAGTPADLGILAGRPVARPRRTDAPPAIDGRLDDEVWRTAAVITEFVQQAPLDGAPATEQTEVYLAYDSEHLYFGFYLHYEDRSIMRANRVDRDRAWQDDLMTVYLDTFMSQQRCYDFDVNAYNVQGDGIITAGGFGGDGGGNAIPNPDRSWDTLFYSGAQIVEDGYTAEMAIPFKSFRYPEQPSGTPHRWGFQIVREIKAKNAENAVWAPMSRDISGFMAQMGVLEGMTDLSTSRNLEILPTFTAIKFGSLDDTTGGFVDQGTTPQAGVNIKYGITSNLTADLAFNPDFSQIESDLAQIDINQRFPLFFSELRPFFLEGQEIFSFTSPVNLVHTRTVVDPYVGGKLTGKVGRTTLGVLVADDAAPGKRDDPFDPGFGQTAQVVIGRAKYDLYAESHIGAIVTDREFLDGYSRVGGVDGQFRLGQTSRFNFVAVQSTHRDEAGRERSGPMAGALLTHNGRNLSASTFAGLIDPDFRTDVGFVRRVDQRLGGVSVGYRWWPESWIISWGPSVSYELSYNHEGIREDERRDLALNLQFAKNISLGVNSNRLLERFGGIDFNRALYNVFSNVNTNRLFGFGAGYSWGEEIFYDPTNPYLGRGSSARLFANLRPVPRLTSQINVNTSQFTDVRSGDVEVFNVKLFRALSTFTFTDRLLIRNITEYNSFAKTLALNFLITYRINALTVFYVGYDDHYQQLDQFYDEFFPGTALRRTNRAFFTKLQYLFRY